MKSSNYHSIINVGLAPCLPLINKILQLDISMAMSTSDGMEISFIVRYSRMWLHQSKPQAKDRLYGYAV